MTESSFTLNVPDSELDLLKKKLELSRLPDELDEAGWSYGVPLTDVKRLVARWKDGYDWRASEKEILSYKPKTLKYGATDRHQVSCSDHFCSSIR